MKLTIKHLPTLPDSPLHPLHCQYDRQSQPQPAFVSLDLRDGVLTADYSAIIGNGVPESVYNGLVRRYTCPADLTAREANTLLDEVAAAAGRVLAGTTLSWHNDHDAAVLDDDAQEAEDDLTTCCAAAETASDGVWPAAEWFRDSDMDPYGLTPTSTPEEILAAANRLQAEARHADATVHDIEEFLTAFVQNMDEDEE